MEKVHQGEAVSIKAATWNSFLDAADFARRARRLVGAEAVPSGFGGNMVYVRNRCGETIPRFGAVVLADAVIPHDAASEDLECDTPAFDGVPADGGGESESEEEAEKDVRPFAVAVEPIENGEIGRALALGVTPAKVEIVHEEDLCAEPVPGSTSGAMRSTNVGYARIVWKEDGTGEKWCFLRLGASEPRADEKSIDFAVRDPETEEDEDAAKTEKLEIKGFSSKEAEEETLGEILSKADEPKTGPEEEEPEDEVIVRSGDRKALRYLKIGGKLATVLEAGDNVTITREGNTITISAEGGAEPGDFVTSGYSTAEGGSDVEIAAIRYYDHQLQVKKAVKVYENGLLKTRVLGDWETFTTAVEETV